MGLPEALARRHGTSRPVHGRPALAHAALLIDRRRGWPGCGVRGGQDRWGLSRPLPLAPPQAYGSPMGAIRAFFLPGSVLPAAPAYTDLTKALGPDVDAFAKDLDLYEADEPPPGWSLDTEVDGVLREADAKQWDTFHLVGYSGGGAAALAFAAKHRERLLSLTLLEPAWAGDWDWSKAHSRLWKRFE